MGPLSVLRARDFRSETQGRTKAVFRWLIFLIMANLPLLSHLIFRQILKDLLNLVGLFLSACFSGKLGSQRAATGACGKAE